ncbi:MAG: nucleotidyltransferase domain-containing protein [Proteobacteria bacterium]|nr:nucleotidyltransferase domain-containing protein [Pseudomonadota bacterium]
MSLSLSQLDWLKNTIQKFFPATDYQIILFGSQSQGTAGPRSDVDIAIRGKAPLSPAEWQKCQEILEESDFPWRVDLVDYRRVSIDFQKIIDQTGKII